MGGQRARREAQQGSAFNGYTCGVITLTTAVQTLKFSAGTRHQQQMLLQADPENVGYVFVGPVDILTSSLYAAKLEPGQFMPINIFDVDRVGVLGQNTSDKISFGGEG